MTDTAARLLRLLSLLQMPREWPGSELADRLGVTDRTVRRDVDRLRELGYPVVAAMGAAGGYRLTAGSALPPLILDADEAVAVAVGLRVAAGQAVAGIEDASVRALTKLEQVLPAKLRRRVRVVGSAVTVRAGEGPTVDPEVLTTLAAAVTNRERLRFTYRDATGAESRRHTEPAGVVAAGRRWYLVAYDLDRDAWRSYRADRIENPHPTGARTTPATSPPPTRPTTSQAAEPTGPQPNTTSTSPSKHHTAASRAASAKNRTPCTPPTTPRAASPPPETTSLHGLPPS